MNRVKGKKSVLSALVPGAQIRSPKRPILVNAGWSRETVTFNIGGTLFETNQTTLHKLPHSPLGDDAFLRRHYRPDKNHYFFDRDPEVFGAILNYLRTGELHLPAKYCGPQIKMEMEYWGLEEDEIEECCWTTYSAWTSTLEALRKLEKDRKSHMPTSVELPFSPGVSASPAFTKLKKVQATGWAIMNNPRSSIFAQIYSYVALGFVVISIFSFVAQTHNFFRVPFDDGLAASNATLNGTLPRGDGNATATTTTATTITATPPSATHSKTTPSTAMDDLDDAHPVMLFIDATCLAFFLTEFFIRVILSPKRLRMFLLPMTIFELLALLPDLIEFGMRIVQPSVRLTSAVDTITFLRLLRVFRIFRLMRHFPGLWILFYTLKASMKELLLLLLFLGVGMLFFASLIYYTDDRTVFTSIPHACWWSVITMTTVGYGDMYPKTEWGYVVGTMTALCGVLVIGFTVPVLVNNFILYYQHTQCALAREGAKQKRVKVRDWRHKDRKRRTRFLTLPAKKGAASASLSRSDANADAVSLASARSRTLSEISESSLLRNDDIARSISDDHAIVASFQLHADGSETSHPPDVDSNGSTLDSDLSGYVEVPGAPVEEDSEMCSVAGEGQNGRGSGAVEEDSGICSVTEEREGIPGTICIQPIELENHGSFRIKAGKFDFNGDCGPYEITAA